MCLEPARRCEIDNRSMFFALPITMRMSPAAKKPAIMLPVWKARLTTSRCGWPAIQNAWQLSSLFTLGPSTTFNWLQIL